MVRDVVDTIPARGPSLLPKRRETTRNQTGIQVDQAQPLLQGYKSHKTRARSDLAPGSRRTALSFDELGAARATA
jgi:hypothetical protein